MDGPGNHFYMKNMNMNNNTNPFRRTTTARPVTMYALGQPQLGPHFNPFEDPAQQPVDVKRRMSTMSTNNPHRRHSHHSNSRHSSRRGRVRPDIIDRLDDVGDFQYHHEGPYDAVYPERNRSSKKSPVEALKESNEMTLKATPADKITDSLKSHRPLDGVAFFPPGHTDRDGHTYDYDEGSNMVDEAYGNFMRMPGFKFTDEDFKNDPFYQDHLRPKRRISLRRVLGLRGRGGRKVATT